MTAQFHVLAAPVTTEHVAWKIHHIQCVCVLFFVVVFCVFFCCCFKVPRHPPFPILSRYWNLLNQWALTIRLMFNCCHFHITVCTYVTESNACTISSAVDDPCDSLIYQPHSTFYQVNISSWGNAGSRRTCSFPVHSREFYVTIPYFLSTIWEIIYANKWQILSV